MKETFFVVARNEGGVSAYLAISLEMEKQKVNSTITSDNGFNAS